MQEPMQQPMQEPKPRKTIHIGYLIAIVILVIVAVVLAVIFWPSKESETPTPTPTPLSTATSTATPVVIPTVAPVGEVSVSIVAPATVDKSVSKEFHVFVNVSTVSNLASAQYDIQYDPKVISYVDATAGNINGANIPVQSKTLVPASKQGIVRIVNLDPGLSGINGEGYLVDIKFRVAGNAGDTSAISFIEISTDIHSTLGLADVTAKEIPSTWGNASVTIE
jgi:hypothetical protein